MFEDLAVSSYDLAEDEKGFLVTIAEASDVMMDEMKSNFPTFHQRVYTDTDDKFKEWQEEIDETAYDAMNTARTTIQKRAQEFGKVTENTDLANTYDMARAGKGKETAGKKKKDGPSGPKHAEAAQREAWGQSRRPSQISRRRPLRKPPMKPRRRRRILDTSVF